jgi:ParB family chromosome partitioning protein
MSEPITARIDLTPQAEMPTTALRPDPANRAIFDPLEGEEFAALVQSIHQEGVINAIAITPDGTIIAGEQRWRAAVAAGLAAVPVRVFDADPQTVERLRIQENLRRRTLKPSEIARAVCRWYELNGAQQGRHVTLPGVTSVAELAEDMGTSEKTVKVYRTLADLIPPLAALLDAGDLPQKAAYQLAQLPSETQHMIADTLDVREMRDAKAMKQLKEALEAHAQEVERLSAALDESAGEQERVRLTQKMEQERRATVAEVERIKAEAAAAVRRLEESLGQRARFENENPAHKTMAGLNGLMSVDPQTFAERLAANSWGVLEAELYLDLLQDTIPWLNRFEGALREVLRAHTTGIVPLAPRDKARQRREAP